MPARSAEIRPARPADLEGVEALYVQLNSIRTKVPAALAAETWARMLAQPGLVVLVADAGGIPVGTCMLMIVPSLAAEARSWAVIENVVTDDAHRRQGIGRALLDEAVRRAWAAGCYKVMLSTGSRQDSTLRFYRDAGFRDDVKTAFEIRPHSS